MIESIVNEIKSLPEGSVVRGYTLLRREEVCMGCRPYPDPCSTATIITIESPIGEVIEEMISPPR